MIPPLNFIPKWLKELWEDELAEQSWKATHGYCPNRLPEIEA